jgi:hypothetical protein
VPINKRKTAVKTVPVFAVKIALREDIFLAGHISARLNRTIIHAKGYLKGYEKHEQTINDSNPRTATNFVCVRSRI